MKNEDILGTVCVFKVNFGVSHPVSRNSKIRFPDIPSTKVANPEARKNPAGPLTNLTIKRLLHSGLINIDWEPIKVGDSCRH